MLRPGDRAPRFEVQPVFGLPVALGETPIVVLFLRSLSGGLARAALVEAERALARVEAAGGRMVAFTTGDLALARDLVPRNHVLIPVVIEPTAARFDAWGVGRDRGLRRSIPALASARTLRTLRVAAAQGRSRPDGGMDRLPAELVVDRDGIVVFANYGDTIWGLPDPEALCAALPR